MPTFNVRLLRVEESANPEEHEHLIEAKDEKDARKQAKALFGERGLGWRSYGDPELWGKVQETVQSVEKIGD